MLQTMPMKKIQIVQRRMLRNVQVSSQSPRAVLKIPQKMENLSTGLVRGLRLRKPLLSSFYIT